MILYIKNLKDSTKKLLEQINKLCKFTGYKINIQKSVAYLYTNNGLLERESKNTNTFTIKFLKNKITRNKFNQGGERPVY